MSIPRFVKEYASYRRKKINENKFMKEEIKEDNLRRIDRTVRHLERGIITVDEAMITLSRNWELEDLCEPVQV